MYMYNICENGAAIGGPASARCAKRHQSISTAHRNETINLLLVPVITLFARDSVHKTCPLSGWQTDIYLSIVKLTVK